MPSSQDKPPNKLPGFGLPLNFIPTDLNKYPMGRLFPSALNNIDMYGGFTALPLTTLREFTMLRIMNQITDKQNWHTKVFDETIADKWKAEFVISGQDVTESMADWIIDELRYKAALFSSTGFVSVYNGDVVKSDSVVPLALKYALQTAVRPLEEVPDWEVDWHPGFHGTVRDLVHPSLFPLVYGRTRILEYGTVLLEDCISRCGEGMTALAPPAVSAERAKRSKHSGHLEVVSNPYSRNYQWLPCEVDISGKEARITSYINNLHPVHYAPLYTLISQIITCAIPLWQATLTPQLPSFRNSYRPRIEYVECEYEDMPEDQYPPQGVDEEDDEYLERIEMWLEEHRVIMLPEPEEFEPPDKRVRKCSEKRVPLDLRKMCKLTGRGLQVIVKFANIELTPEEPEYAGGTWHVEGQLNEHICATALYYYSSSNITTSKLAFRQQTSIDDANEVVYEQNYHAWLPAVFGCENDGPAVQIIGSVDTSEGRLLTFPNILQHQVQPFSLADKSKNGWRKILALFLVDPHVQVTSTAHVPPQQKEWWREAVVAGQRGISGVLPSELQDQVFNFVEGFPISLEEAKEMRLKLMEERRVFMQGHENTYMHTTFSLCEH